MSFDDLKREVNSKPDLKRIEKLLRKNAGHISSPPGGNTPENRAVAIERVGELIDEWRTLREVRGGKSSVSRTRGADRQRNGQKPPHHQKDIMSISTILFAIATLVFALVAFGVSSDDVNLLAVGLALVAGGLTVGGLGDRRIG